LLGETLDASTIGGGLKELSAVVLLAGVATYHGLILRADLQHVATGPERMPVVALVAPGAEEMLVDLRQHSGLRIEVIGYLSPDQTSDHADVGTLPTLL